MKPKHQLKQTRRAEANREIGLGESNQYMPTTRGYSSESFLSDDKEVGNKVQQREQNSDTDKNGQWWFSDHSGNQWQPWLLIAQRL